MHKFRFLILLAALIVANAHARSLLEHPHFEMEPGRQIYVEMRRAQVEGKPTLLFLPGLFCAPKLDEKFIKILNEAGFGAIIMNFSLQAPSINLLDRDQKPLFKFRDLTLRDLADEVEFVAKMVRAEFPGIQIIPVSLSYSSIITPYLTSFTHIIETSPMTSTWSAIPDIQNMRSFLNFNPMLSQGTIRRLLDQTYFNASWAVTEFTINQYNLPHTRTFEMNEGYEALMRMAEDFDWMKVPLESVAHRDWIVAANERYSLKTHQQRAITRFSQAKPSSRMIEIRGTTHIIKNHQPEKLAEAIAQFASGCETHVTL